MRNIQPHVLVKLLLRQNDLAYWLTDRCANYQVIARFAFQFDKPEIFPSLEYWTGPLRRSASLLAYSSLRLLLHHGRPISLQGHGITSL
jgi:hypothetical protein